MDITDLLLDKKLYETDKYIYFLTLDCTVLVFEKDGENFLPQLRISNLYTGLEFIVLDISDDRGDYFIVNSGKEIEETCGIPVDENVMIYLHEETVKRTIQRKVGKGILYEVK